MGISNKPKKVVIIGGGFAGFNAAKILGNKKNISVVLIDRNNHHLFQPLLYQVATAGLSPAEIAAPIRSLLSNYKNIVVLQGEAKKIDPVANQVVTDFGDISFDYLILACGAKHSYFGNEQWEIFAPGLKTLEQATEIRRRVLSSFEEAEKTQNNNQKAKFLTFIIVGGGPTGVELAGAIGEMSRFTLARDFRNIDSKSTRIILVEAGQRILPSFSSELAERAQSDLEKLGVEVLTSSRVTNIDALGCEIGSKRIEAATVLWAAGVQASPIGMKSGFKTDEQGRIIVERDLSLLNYSHIFAAGDLAHFDHQTGKPLAGMAPAAMQEGRFIAKNILREVAGKPRTNFSFTDKGQMATIGRSRAILELGKLKLAGVLAWFMWLIVHIYYLTGFKNRLFVVLQWSWSYITFRRGSRLIINKEWQFWKTSKKDTD